MGPSLEDKPEELNTENLAQVGPISAGQMTGEVESFAMQRLLESRAKRLEESEAQKLEVVPISFSFLFLFFSFLFLFL